MHKLTLSLLLVVIASMFGLGWALDNLFEQVAEEPPHDQYLPYKQMGSVLAKTLDERVSVSNTLNLLNEKSDVELVLKPLQEFLLPAELESDFLGGKGLSLESTDGVSLNFYLPKNEQVLTLNMQEGAQEVSKVSLRLIFTVVFYGGIVVIVLLWLYPLVNQLGKVQNTAKGLGRGDLSQRISSRKFSYIPEIEREFNRMADRIQVLVNDNKLLSSAVSHDLRTPLARLRFGIDALEEMEDPEIRAKYQQRISNDLDEMESLVETLLNYARLDQAMVQIHKEPIDLVALVKQCIEHSNHQGIMWSYEPAENISILGDPKYMSMLINNLLGNAFRHANSRVNIRVFREEGNIKLVIEDDGSGVPMDERDSVLKPFVRGRETASSEGFGMGLAISQRIAEWHGGSIVISESKSLKGARFSFVL